MSDEPVAVDEKLVALRLAAEDRVVVENKARAACRTAPFEEQRRRQSADASADEAPAETTEAPAEGDNQEA